MIEKMVKPVNDKKDIVVKMYGAASIFKNNEKYRSVGEENVDEAYGVLQKHNLTIQSSDVGNDYGRSLYLFSDTGDVYLANIKEGLFPLKRK